MHEVIQWHPVSVSPTNGSRCLVHAVNDYFVVAVYDSETQKFWDKDGQPVVGGIEWSYRPYREIN